MKTMNLLIATALLVAMAVPAMSADSLNEQQKAQSKLLAYRAARVDAIRKLAERIKGLQITSETTVKDFVTESDSIRTAMEAFLSGAEEVSKPKYMEDGTCSVTMKVSLLEVITELQRVRNAYYKGDKYKVDDFQKMTVTNNIKEIVETGSGAPRPTAAEAETIAINSGESADSVEYPVGVKAYWLAHVTGQGRLMAVRAARVDAMRRLAERIKGVYISSDTTVSDFVAEEDIIKTGMRTFLKGARETSIKFHNDELIVEVEMQVKLRTVLADLKSCVEERYKGDSVKIKRFDEISTRVEDIIIKETGSGVPPQKYLKDLPPAESAAMEMAQNAPPWASQTIRVKGSAAIDAENPNAAQATLMAYRGAELDARRKLAEQVDGLFISGKTTVQDFVTQSDEIRTAMLTFQQGVRVLDESKKVADGIATIDVELDLQPLWEMVLHYKKLGIKIGPGGTEIRSEESIKVQAPVAD
jgi:hypothetical protein